MEDWSEEVVGNQSKDGSEEGFAFIIRREQGARANGVRAADAKKDSTCVSGRTFAWRLGAERIHPAQAGKTGEIGVVAVQLRLVFNGERGQLGVCG